MKYYKVVLNYDMYESMGRRLKFPGIGVNGHATYHAVEDFQSLIEHLDAKNKCFTAFGAKINEEKIEELTAEEYMELLINEIKEYSVRKLIEKNNASNEVFDAWRNNTEILINALHLIIDKMHEEELLKLDFKKIIEEDTE